MQFTFIWAGYEGSAHDSRIFHEAIYNLNIKFSKPPKGILDRTTRLLLEFSFI
jgi:hypothetical protein